MTNTPMHPAPVTTAPNGTLPEQALRYLGLHPDNPATYALALLARRYELDPILNEVAVIKGKAYVTRDGMLTIAHRSGQFDGMTTDELREGDSGWAATVTVWRKDMTHGFTYGAGCGKQEPQARQGYGPEMALARAERRALLRAFNIPSGGSGDYDDDKANGLYTNPPVVAEVEQPDPLRPVVERGPDRPAVDTTGTVFVVPTKEQAARVKELRGRHPAADSGAGWYAYVSDVIGRPITNTRELSRADTDELIWRMEADLAPPPAEGELL